VSGGAASRRDHDRFCQIEGWDQVRNARGRTGHHHTHELKLADDRILRTRISHPINNETHGARTWSHILRDQLDVTEAEFWACVDERKLPDRGTAADEAPANALPASLVYQLIHVVGVPEAEVATMTRDRAFAVMTEHWSQPPKS
jgi:hypothetical protein